MYLKALQGIGHFFVQNQQSKDLLNKYGINQVSVSGDTRFDRVREITNSAKQLPDVENFLENKPCWVIGSAWAEDLAVLNPLFLKYQNTFKFIFAPHHVDSVSIQYFEKHISIPALKYSDLQHSNSESELLIIDQIGLLSSLYCFATFAWVGGAFGKGLHNILEAAAYGVPVFFGDKNFNKFREAVDLIKLNAAFSCSDFSTLDRILENFENNPNDLTAAKAAASKYVIEHTGATGMIMDYLKTEFHS
jgi:3-deoxy-D-manno-octulosonic-acid transferase